MSTRRNSLPSRILPPGVRVVHPSPTQYAQCGDGYIAYRVCGDGPVDLILTSDWFSHAEEMWSAILAAATRPRNASRRSAGSSRSTAAASASPILSRSTQLPTLEEWMHDVDAVMDACGIERAAIVAKGSAGAMGLMFAASHPERVSSLVLVNSYAKLTASDDYPIGTSPADTEYSLRELYPPKDSVRMLAGGELDEATAMWWNRYLRFCAGPGTTLAMRRMLYSVDVRSVLSAVRTPTLVLHRRDDRWIDVAHGRYLAEHIDGARLVELPGAADLLFAGDPTDLVGEIEEFLTGSRPAVVSDSVLGTVLFTDLVDSTGRAATVGDRAWSNVIDQHEQTVRSELETVPRPRDQDDGGRVPRGVRRPGARDPLRAVDRRRARRRSASTCASDSTRVRSNCAATTSPGWP